MSPRASVEAMGIAKLYVDHEAYPGGDGEGTCSRAYSPYNKCDCDFVARADTLALAIDALVLRAVEAERERTIEECVKIADKAQRPFWKGEQGYILADVIGGQLRALRRAPAKAKEQE